jgi:hypothetical protein
MTKTEAQSAALAQNKTLPDFQAAETAIKVAAGLGLFSAEYTVTDLDVLAQVVESLKLQGFTVAQSGDDDEILAITFGA